MIPDEELTRRLAIATTQHVDEREREYSPFYNKRVCTYQAAKDSKMQWWWGGNGVAYTTLHLESIVDSLEFENKPDLSKLMAPPSATAKRWMFIGNPKGEAFSSVGINVTQKDRERIDTMAHLQFYDVSDKDGLDQLIIQSAYGAKKIVTVIDQPGGKTKIPGAFFDKIYTAVQTQKGQLFITKVYDNEGDWHGKNSFCVAAV